MSIKVTERGVEKLQVQDWAAKFEPDRQGLRQLQKIGVEPRHFFDIGACNGAWTRFVQLDFPNARFDMFEPLSDHAPILRKRLDETVDGKRCWLHKIALGSETKRTTMFVYPDNPAASTALELGFQPEDANPIEIEMMTVDDAVDKLALPTPDVIKMDTQGCELNILKGARKILPHVQVLLLECWLKRAYGPKTPLLLEVAEWLREFDFHLVELGDGWRDENGTLGSQDCFFLNARSKGSPLHNEARRLQINGEHASNNDRIHRPASGLRKAVGKLFGK